MKFKKSSIEELKRIVEKSYGVLLSDKEANEFGLSLLRLTRLGISALTKADEQIALVRSGKGENLS